MPGGKDDPVYAPYRAKIAPDTTACIFWLKNRRPDVWREKSTVDVNNLQSASQLTNDKLAHIAAGGSFDSAIATKGDSKPH